MDYRPLEGFIFAATPFNFNRHRRKPAVRAGLTGVTPWCGSRPPPPNTRRISSWRFYGKLAYRRSHQPRLWRRRRNCRHVHFAKPSRSRLHGEHEVLAPGFSDLNADSFDSASRQPVQDTTNTAVEPVKCTRNGRDAEMHMSANFGAVAIDEVDDSRR